MNCITVESVYKSFGEGTTEVNDVLKDINFHLAEGEFVAIVGYSGSGKSTFMALLAGLLLPDTGKIVYKGQPVVEPSPKRVLVFQNYSLLPWLNVYQNIELAVAEVFPDRSKSEVHEQVEKYIKMVNLYPARHKKPNELSGGMRQRVSLARALSMEPDLLLLDEPLSALDALTRSNLQQEIINIWEKQKRSVVMITNDVDEAILMADRIIPLSCGPRATLGPGYVNNLDRRRRISNLSKNPTYQSLRRNIVDYLIDTKKSNTTVLEKTLVLPEVEPEDISVRTSFTLFGKHPQRKSEERKISVK